MATNAEVYRRAAVLLETYGWGRNENVGSRGQRCLTAAINEADNRMSWAASDDLMGPLAGWLVSTRREEVAAALTAAGHVVTTGRARSILDGRFTEYQAINVCQLWNDVAKAEPAELPRWKRDGVRTRDEVIGVLREFADHLESAEV